MPAETRSRCPVANVVAWTASWTRRKSWFASSTVDSGRITANSSPPTRQRESDRPDGFTEALGRLGEDAVAGEVADPVVHPLEVVEIEDDQGEIAAVALCTQHLSPERLVEVALVVQARQRVCLGELPGLAIAPRVLDRRHGALGELLRSLDLLPGRLVSGPAPEESQRAERAQLAALKRYEEAAPDRLGAGCVALRAVAVGDGDRAGRRRACPSRRSEDAQPRRRSSRGQR